MFRKRLRKQTMAQSTVSCCSAVTAGHDHVHFFLSSRQHAERRGWPTPATKHIYLSTLWRLRGQDSGSLFFFPIPLFFAVFSPDRSWSLSSPRSLDSCRRNSLRSLSSVRPVDSRVAARQHIMKWPWSGVSEAAEPLEALTSQRESFSCRGSPS